MNTHHRRLFYKILLISFITGVFLMWNSTLQAQLRVHHIFDNNMVLQRDQPVRVWGWANVGKEVTVEFAGQKKILLCSRMVNGK